MITIAEADALEATTKDGDVLVYRDSRGSWTVIWRDDAEAERRGAEPGGYWFDDIEVDPTRLCVHLTPAVEVRAAGQRLLPVGVSDEDLRTPNWLPLRAFVTDIGPWMWVNATVHEGKRIDHYEHRRTGAFLNLDSGGQAHPDGESDQQVETTEALRDALA